MTPEQRSRLEIDRQLLQCGWTVQTFRDMNISAGLGVAVREFPLKSGLADYLLYADCKALGVIEAKPEGHNLTGVETQSGKYMDGLPKGLPHFRLPLPFAYESTGTVTHFTNALEPDARSREVFTFHRPDELIRLVTLDQQMRGLLRTMPPLNTERLWRVQVDSIQNLEASPGDNRPRSLIQMATGSGKTYTAVSFSYRLIKFGRARRILFLVDRNNLGKQTLNEFQQFVSPYTNRKFTEEYTVQHLKRNSIDPASKVCITTIQRLYSMLKGEEEFLEENEESSLYETEAALIKEPLPVIYNPKIPIETFDVIVVDECHRSIYNIWRQVLEYFDAFLIGLTATPTTQTIGFFNGNLVQDYTHEQAVADGVNVGYDVYRIETKISRDGAKLVREPGVFVPHRDRRTKSKKYKELDDDLAYAATQLDRDVVAENQIRLVVRTFKEKLPEIFPGRTEVPKTLVFAKTDLHAEDIVRIMREEFGKGNDFCQKITSKTTGKKPEDLLSEFRNSYNPRIAVTVDMIATGTDVKPLECLLFMRNIRSLSYFEQMKGRGCRVVDPDALQMVTPDAKQKTHFVIVDAVGVCEEEKAATKPLDRKPTVALDKIMALVGAGADADLVSTLAARLTRLDRQLSPAQKTAVAKEAGGKDLTALCGQLLTVAALKRVRANLKRYRAAVLKAAVEGKLTEGWRAKHPKTEPASKLLERILAERRKKWEEDQLAKFAAADKTPPKGWREKYVEPAGPDTSGLPELPQGWCWASLDQLSIVVRGASPRPAGDPRYFGGPVPWITVGTLTADENPYLREVPEGLTEAGRDVSRYIQPDTLLLTNSGATLGVPKITLIGGCINDGSVALFHVNYPLKLYLYYFLKTQTRTLRAINQGAAQPNLNTGIVKAIVVPLPPLAEEQQILAEIERRSSVIAENETMFDANLKRTGRLRQSILKRAFEGKLVPQDPTDEPADKLLDRIRQERTATNGDGVASRTRRSRKAKQAES